MLCGVRAGRGAPEGARRGGDPAEAADSVPSRGRALAGETHAALAPKPGLRGLRPDASPPAKGSPGQLLPQWCRQLRRPRLNCCVASPDTCLDQGLHWGWVCIAGPMVASAQVVPGPASQEQQTFQREMTQAAPQQPGPGPGCQDSDPEGSCLGLCSHRQEPLEGRVLVGKPCPLQLGVRGSGQIFCGRETGAQTNLSEGLRPRGC